MNLHQGDNLDILKDIPDNSIDSCVTDGPYGLSFMNKKWDYDVPSVEFWREVLRVLKPGAHVLSFGGTRTYHRMTCNIEDAGFEIRDCVNWIYGSGFPKSHNISKGIDKRLGSLKEVSTGETCPDIRADNYSNSEGKDRLEIKKQIANSDLAKQWDGFGTALKPANEPICLARKPLSEKTIVDNVLKWGVGGINIDGCRVETEESLSSGRHITPTTQGPSGYRDVNRTKYEQNTQGRFPANILLDEVAGEMLDEQSGMLKSGGGDRNSATKSEAFNGYGDTGIKREFPSSVGGASRFFYCAKASKSERNAGLEGMEAKESGIKNDSGRGFSESDPYKKVLNQNHHPTVKPIKLMRYLTRLITPPNGTCIDPFMGSGTTGIACREEGFDFIGIELNQEYFEIAERRINASS